MRFLIAHNFYQQAGGEDRVFQAEGQLLEQHGHEVQRFAVHNSAIHERPNFVRLAAATVWNQSSYTRFRELLAETRPDVVHIHNTLPLLSPAIYYAAAAAGVPVVQTLHNFRLICPGSLLYREDRICEECVGRTVALPGIMHACYRQSRPATAAVAGMVSVHRAIGTWRRRVDAYIATTEFARQKLIAGGLPAEKIIAKPNFIDPDPGEGDHSENFALFVGRVTQDKGIPTLLDAWKKLGHRIPLKIVGVGPLFPGAGTDESSNVEWLGRKQTPEVLDLMKRAKVLVLPSNWYEGFPVTLVEAFATASIVVASNIGSMGEIVEDGVNGLHFTPGDADDLVRAVHQVLDNPEMARRMSARARDDFLTKYSAEVNYTMMMQIYHAALARQPVGAFASPLAADPHFAF